MTRSARATASDADRRHDKVIRLMKDEYPLFRLGMGGDEPRGTMTVPPARPAPVGTPLVHTPSQRDRG
jgi:hypothetical protein